MRIIKIHRKKKFAGALIPYWVITKVPKEAFLEFLQKYCSNPSNINEEEGCVYKDLIEDKFGERIKNGETLELEINDDVNSFFVTNGVYGISDEVMLEAGVEFFCFEVDTKGGFSVPSYPVVYRK